MMPVPVTLICSIYAVNVAPNGQVLDEPGLRLVWDELRASDLAGRARAFQSMVGAGMDIAKAAALPGLTEAE